MRVRAGVVAAVAVVVTVVVAGGGCAGGVPAGDGAAGTAGGMRTSPQAAGGEASPGATGGVEARSRATGAGCNGTSVFEGDGFPEVRGTARDAELWGLLFVRATPLRAGDEVKIVWRMTGEGPLRIRAVHPDGTAAERVWGPEEHGGSSWRRPGQEWGTGFVFPKPGCWKVELSRSRGSGHVWLPVR
ncbi:hypothetical protein [Nonomuraea rubra]|uniref:DUF2914 domain-containing protein n=2 Tax=Nonomuraea rubra TaxID=46180 RepID=A0A7X0P4E6_9ACTN|nr:hypothetical protein [Nonomuraea rubra]MBB6555084.1 hypothetical protein [Nonomuraea rubra]